ncbi:hypothetical protein [Dasineura jujubifolia toursvirus 2a]|nr:hypothetical protein [Dasineura jujubifolia toursvirus 2a]
MDQINEIFYGHINLGFNNEDFYESDDETSSELDDEIYYTSSSEKDSDDDWDEDDYKYIFPKQYYDLYNQPPHTKSSQYNDEKDNDKSVENGNRLWDKKCLTSNYIVDNNNKYLNRKCGLGNNISDIIWFGGYVEKGIHMWTLNWNINQRHYRSSIGFIFEPLSSKPGETLKTNNIICNTNNNFIYRNNSVSWNLYNKSIEMSYENSFCYKYFPSRNFVIPSKITIVVDMNKGVIGVISRGKYMGTMVNGINNCRVFPGVNVSNGCKIKLEYNGNIMGPPSLKDLASNYVADNYISLRELPRSLSSYVTKYFYP